MARSNGPFGPAGTRPQARRHPGDDPFAPPSGQPNGHWPPLSRSWACRTAGAGLSFPAGARSKLRLSAAASPHPSTAIRADTQHDPYAPQQWGQPDPRGYDLGNYMPNGAQQHYPPADPAAVPQQGADHDPYAQQGYGDAERRVRGRVCRRRDEPAADAAGCSSWRRWSVRSASEARLPTPTSPSSRPTAGACRW